MIKRKHLLTVALLISSISLVGCSSQTVEDPTYVEPIEEQEVVETIPFSSASIFPSVLKVNTGETLQASVVTYPSNATESGVVWVSQNEEIATVDENGLITGIKSGTSKISVYGAETNLLLGSKILTVVFVPQPEEIVHIDIPESTEKTEMSFTYKDYAKHSAYDNLDYCPTIGTAKLLVIPIWFKDSSSFISLDNKENVRQDIERAYFGTDVDTGWKSVKTYYEEESNGLLTIDGTVSKWREIKSSYTNFAKNSDTTTSLVRESVNWFFNLPENSSLSRSDFDGDNNGYLDGVMLIYGAPDQSALGDDSSSNLWAYTYWLFSNASPSYPVPNAFFWASYDFMYSGGSYALERTGKSEYGSGFTNHCAIDTHTFIHEMGHVFGLDDYYDYSGQYSPAGGFSMQDYNIGSHDPFSIMSYGWVKPNVVTDSTELVIESFQKSRDLILISPKWNGYKSPFDEYILLELYSPTGLNQFDCDHKYGYYGQGPNVTAIRIWHVDARLASFDSEHNITLTTNVNNPGVGVITAFNNTYYRENGYNNERISAMGIKYADYNLLQLIRNDKTETYRPKSFLSEKSLFKTGIYNLKDYAGQFVHGEKEEFNNGESLDWTIDITIGVSDNDSAAIVKITKNS